MSHINNNDISLQSYRENHDNLKPKGLEKLEEREERKKRKQKNEEKTEQLPSKDLTSDL